jgi:uridylate kinase
MAAYQRLMLKLSGEVLGGSAGQGLDKEALTLLAGEILAVAESGVQTAIVVGGGNILRGAQNALTIERTTGDYMGMLATIINALALQAAIENLGGECRVLSAIETRKVCEFFIRRRAIRHMEKGRIVVLAGGTGNPYFTTDTAAALRATELDCEVLLKATKVDGIYSDAPVLKPEATRFERISFSECIRRNLGVMDQAAFSLCMENEMPILVFSLRDPANIGRAAEGDLSIGTLVTSTGE